LAEGKSDNPPKEHQKSCHVIGDFFEKKRWIKNFEERIRTSKEEGCSSRRWKVKKGKAITVGSLVSWLFST